MNADLGRHLDPGSALLPEDGRHGTDDLRHGKADALDIPAGQV
jgi:hypothetical protein